MLDYYGTPWDDIPVVGLGVKAGSLAASGIAKILGNETTTLFRAVTAGKAAQVARTGAFQAGEYFLGGKWFALSAEHAQQWGGTMNGIGNSTILQVEVATSSVATFFKNNHLDNIGPAVYGELDQLKNAVIKAFQ